MNANIAWLINALAFSQIYHLSQLAALLLNFRPLMNSIRRFRFLHAWHHRSQRLQAPLPHGISFWICQEYRILLFELS